MRLSLLLLVLLVSSSASAQGTGTIAGQVIEADGVTAVIGGNVRVDGTALGAVTDIDGNYRILGVSAGTYSVSASFTGYTSQTQTGVDVDAGSTRQLNFTLGMGDFEHDLGCYYEAPMFTNDAIGMPRTLVGEDIERMPLNR